jgi:hypothetical protein
MKRIVSAPNLQAKVEHQLEPENRVLKTLPRVRSLDVISYGARSLSLAEPAQNKKKKARRPRLVWTDGLHLRFVLSIVQGTKMTFRNPYFFHSYISNFVSPVLLWLSRTVGLQHATPAKIIEEPCFAEYISKTSFRSIASLKEVIKLYLKLYLKNLFSLNTQVNCLFGARTFWR